MGQWGKKYGNRVDKNHSLIVDALRAAGRSVLDLSDAGRGVPDILVSDSSDMWLLEIKYEKGQLTDAQKEFHDNWRGKPILIARTIDEAVTLTEPSRRERLADSVARKLLQIINDENG